MVRVRAHADADHDLDAVVVTVGTFELAVARCLHARTGIVDALVLDDPGSAPEAFRQAVRQYGIGRRDHMTLVVNEGRRTRQRAHDVAQHRRKLGGGVEDDRDAARK